MREKTLSSGELSMLCMELYEIWHAGLPLADGLLALSGENQEAGAVIASLYREAEEGATLSVALRNVGGFPKYMVEMLALADKTGKQEVTLRALSEYYDRSDRMRASIRSAVLYPAVLTAVMLVVIVVLATQVLPIFQSVFEQLGMRMSGLAAGMMQAGSVISYVMIVLGVLILIAGLVFLFAKWRPAFGTQLSTRLLGVFGGLGVIARVTSSRFLAAMAMAVESGMDMEQAVSYAAEICPNDPRTKQRLASCREKLEQGARIGEALEGLLSPRNCRLIALSERTGSQAEVFDEVAKRSDRAVQEELDRMVGWIEPTLVIVTAVLVGAILLSVMLPLLGIMSSIG